MAQCSFYVFEVLDQSLGILARLLIDALCFAVILFKQGINGLLSVCVKFFMFFTQLHPYFHNLRVSRVHRIVKMAKTAFSVIDLQWQDRSLPDDMFKVSKPVLVCSDRLLNIYNKIFVLQPVKGVLGHVAHNLCRLIQRGLNRLQRCGNIVNILALLLQFNRFFMKYTALAVNVGRTGFQLNDGTADLLAESCQG